MTDFKNCLFSIINYLWGDKMSLNHDTTAIDNIFNEPVLIQSDSMNQLIIKRVCDLEPGGKLNNGHEDLMRFLIVGGAGSDINKYNIAGMGLYQKPTLDSSTNTITNLDNMRCYAYYKIIGAGNAEVRCYNDKLELIRGPVYIQIENDYININLLLKDLATACKLDLSKYKQ